MGNIDRICYLLKECGGSVYQLARFQIGIYALSEGCVDDLNLEKIFSYKFDGLNYTGPVDSELERDVGRMVTLNYIDKGEMQRLNDRTEHQFLFLLKRGMKAADKIAAPRLIGKEKESIEQVAEKLKNMKIKVSDLLHEYCPKWREQSIRELETTLIQENQILIFNT